MRLFHQKRSGAIKVTVGISVLLSAILACTMDFNSIVTVPDETEISKSVEETLTAEQALTVQALQSLGSASPAVTNTPEVFPVQQTIEAQQATLDAQSTMISRPNPTLTLIQETLPPTITPPVSMEPIPLGDWKLINMRQAPGCGEDRNGPPCWYGTAEDLSITSTKPLIIDPSWPNPHLVFTHRYVFIHNATIYVNIGGGWEILWSFPAGQSTPWVPFQVDLSKFKEKEIMLQMYATGSSTTASGNVKVSTWYIRDPQIIPDYSQY